MSRQPLIPPCLRVLPAITLVLVLLLALGPLSNGLSPSRTALYGARKMPDSPESSRKFQELCVSGLAQFKSGEFDACIDSLDTAAKMKTNQPLVQRGIILYCMGRYEEALAQLVSDTFLLEQARLCKASDLRLWQAACCNKLGQPENAIVALDLPCFSFGALEEDRYVLNTTLSFFGKQATLDDMLEMIGDSDEKDPMGAIFYGNFYLGLYFDSIGDSGLAQAFLRFPFESARYPPSDMWYHLPRALFRMRGWSADEAEG